MNKIDKINVELYFQLIDLKENLDEIIETCTQQLELIDPNSQMVQLLKEEIEVSKSHLDFMNKELHKLLSEIDVATLDEIIKNSDSKLVDFLLDIRNKKDSK